MTTLLNEVFLLLILCGVESLRLYIGQVWELFLVITSVSDPDSTGSADPNSNPDPERQKWPAKKENILNLTFWTTGRSSQRFRVSWERQWIRIRNPDPDPGGQKWHTKLEKIRKFHVLKCWMFSFEGWRPRDRKIVVFDKIKVKFFCFNFFKFFVIKTVDPDWYLA